MDEVPFFYQLHVGKYQKELILVGWYQLVYTINYLIILDHHYGRAVVIVGVPYVYTQSRILKVNFDNRLFCYANSSFQKIVTRQPFYADNI